MSTIEKTTNEKISNRKRDEHRRIIKKQRQYNRLMSQIIRIVILMIFAVILICFGINIKAENSVKYQKNNNIAYKVYLKDNEYYDEEYLDQDMQYIANLIDYIQVNFKSVFSLDELCDIQYKYSINAYINVTDPANNDKNLYSKTFNLVNNKSKIENGVRSIAINENVKVDYQEYNDIVKTFKTSYGLSANSILLLELKVDVNCTPCTFNNSFSDTYTSRLTAPLTTQTVNISLDKSSSNKDVTKVEYLPSDYSKYFYIAAAIPALLSLVLFIGMIKYVKKLNKNKKPYADYINKILREYDRAIIQIKEGYVFKDSTIIDVKTFDELLNIHDSTNQPIACVEDFSEIDNEKTIFFIKNNEDIYRYIVEKINFASNI